MRIESAWKLRPKPFILRGGPCLAKWDVRYYKTGRSKQTVCYGKHFIKQSVDLATNIPISTKLYLSNSQL